MKEIKVLDTFKKKLRWDYVTIFFFDVQL